jgi:hypothetical protein
MLWIEIDVPPNMHEVEIQNEEGKKMWSARVINDRRESENLMEKMRTVENANGQRV